MPTHKSPIIPHLMSDAEAVEDIIQGGDRGWEALYKRYATSIHKHLIDFYTTGDNARLTDKDIEDLLHDIFISAIKNIKEEKLRNPDAVGGWLFHIAHSVTRDYLDKVKRNYWSEKKQAVTSSNNSSVQSSTPRGKWWKTKKVIPFTEEHAKTQHTHHSKTVSIDDEGDIDVNPTPEASFYAERHAQDNKNCVSKIRAEMLRSNDTQGQNCLKQLLTYYKDKPSYKEIAENMGKTESAARKWMSDCRKKLRERYIMRFCKELHLDIEISKK